MVNTVIPADVHTEADESQQELFDITIIGAGPTGLFTAFYAGLRGMSVQVIDSLEEPGGALTAIYPEKYIYDVIGYPKILAKDFVTACVDQAMRSDPTIHLKEQVLELHPQADGTFDLVTSKTTRRSRAVIVAAGVGAFEPTRLTAQGVNELEGKGVHYFAKHVDDFRDKHVVIVGGGDSAVDWAVTLEPVASSVNLIHRSKFRAHEAVVDELVQSTVQLHYPGCEVTEIRPGADGRIGSLSFKNADGEIADLDVEELICAIGFKADPGPLRTWGFELARNQIQVDKITMETNIPGVYGAGDIVSYPAKFKLIATGAAEAVTAVNHAVTYINPDARLDAGHSTTIMEKRAKQAAKS